MVENVAMGGSRTVGGTDNVWLVSVLRRRTRECHLRGLTRATFPRHLELKVVSAGLGHIKSLNPGVRFVTSRSRIKSLASNLRFAFLPLWVNFGKIVASLMIALDARPSGSTTVGSTGAPSAALFSRVKKGSLGETGSGDSPAHSGTSKGISENSRP
jgi:hypothetical protein